jgi:hypothetical protein
VIESLGAGTTVAMLTAFAIANAVLVGLLWAICRRARNEAVT